VVPSVVLVRCSRCGRRPVRDGAVGGREALTPMGPARRLLPALGGGQGVLDGDPIRGVRVAVEFPPFVELGQSAPARLARRGEGLMRVTTPQAGVSVVERHLHLGKAAKAGVDALGAHRGGVVHPPGSHRIGPQGAPSVVGHDGGLHGVLLLPHPGGGGAGPRGKALGPTWCEAPVSRPQVGGLWETGTSPNVTRRPRSSPNDCRAPREPGFAQVTPGRGKRRDQLLAR
jgi:hypothetical protein